MSNTCTHLHLLKKATTGTQHVNMSQSNLTIARASERILGTVKMLYSIPFTYSFICSTQINKMCCSYMAYFTYRKITTVRS